MVLLKEMYLKILTQAKKTQTATTSLYLGFQHRKRSPSSGAEPGLPVAQELKVGELVRRLNQLLNLLLHFEVSECRERDTDQGYLISK